ncbi:unnamed protein product [Gadus morhua 'NCC']
MNEQSFHRLNFHYRKKKENENKPTGSCSTLISPAPSPSSGPHSTNPGDPQLLLLFPAKAAWNDSADRQRPAGRTSRTNVGQDI